MGLTFWQARNHHLVDPLSDRQCRCNFHHRDTAGAHVPYRYESGEPYSSTLDIDSINRLDRRIWTGRYCVFTLLRGSNGIESWDREFAAFVSQRTPYFGMPGLNALVRLVAMMSFMMVLWYFVPDRPRHSD